MVAIHTVKSLQNDNNNKKACDPLKHQTSHTYKNICALKKKCFNSDTQTAPVAIINIMVAIVGTAKTTLCT